MTTNIADISLASPVHEVDDLFPGPLAQRTRYLLLKRVMDLVLCSFLLIAAAPVILFAGFLIRLESRGSAIYIQQRVGAKCRRKNGGLVWELCLFPCFKLRTMYEDADFEVHRDYLRRFRNGAAERGHQNAPFKLCRDRRVTKIGRWLRKTSFDELPQLLNVMRGEMSLVGPRPVPGYEVELYDRLHYDRLAAKPGITGVWQVYGRSRVTFEQMMEMDASYVRQSSLMLDMKLVAMTIVAVMFSKGAM